MKLVLLLAQLVLFASFAPAIDFKFNYVAGSSYRILSEIQQDVTVNGIFSHHGYILNRIALDIVKTDTNGATLHANYVTTEELRRPDQAYKLANEYEVDFFRDFFGKMTVGPNTYVPTVRSVPSFSGRDVKPGDEWTARGSEVHDLRKALGLTAPFEFPIQVNYTYVGTVERDQKSYEQIDVAYTIFQRYPKSVGNKRAPTQVSGYSNQHMFWNKEKGRLEFYEEEFVIVLSFLDGDNMQFEGTAKSRIVESIEQDTAKIKDDLNEAVKDLPNVTIHEDDKGITLSLDNIQFEADSAVLKPEEKAKLDAISEILKKYAQYDLLVSGHTALAGTPEGRQKLSEERAQAVGQYLLQNKVRNRDQIITKGFGSSVPVDTNETEAGRSHNRRVEITILKN